MLKSDKEPKKLTALLLKQVLELLSKVQPPPTSLKQQVLAGYYKSKLNELAKLLKKDDPKQLIKDLKDFLALNWTKINGASLSYTALATHELTLLLCDIAQSINDYSDEQTPILKLLMPTLVLEATRTDFISLDKLNVQQVQQVLKTHILGQGGKYLIPVSQLISLQNTPPQQWGNGYYDYSQHTAAMVNLNQEEYERLSRHSPETMAFVNAHKQYHLCLKQNDSLLAHLEQLCRSLYFNSNKGIGTEHSAGSGAYEAIIQFNEYYSKLDESIKKDIPAKVKTEIELLFNFSSNSALNKNATDAMGTCIATRRDDLIAAMIPVTTILEELGLSDKAKKDLIAEKKKQLEECQAALNKAILLPTYNGIDSLGLTRSLMSTLGIKYKITSQNDMKQLINLTAEELNDLCQDPFIQDQVVDQFIDLETLIFFIHETPIDQLKVILTICGKVLREELIHSPQDISALLSSMDKEYPVLICSLLKKHLLPIIKNADGFNQALENLSFEQRNALYLMMQDTLPNLIKSVVDFALMSHYLTPDQRSAVYLMIAKRLPTLIKSANDMMLVLHYLSPKDRSAVYLSLGDKISAYINNANELGLALRNISPEQCNTVFEMIEKKIPSLIKSPYDVLTILQSLSQEQRSTVYQRIKKRLPILITQGEEVALVLEHLSPDERTAVFLAISDKVPTLIKSPVDVGWFLEFLTLEQRNSVYLLIKNQLPTLIKTSFDLQWLLRNLTPEQCSEVCLSINANLPTILKSTAERELLLQKCSAEQLNAISPIINALPPIIKEQNPDLIKNTNVPDPVQKKKMSYFLSLLEGVKDKSREFKDKGHIPAHVAAKELFKSLEKASVAYFGNDTTQPSINYPEFKSLCETAISEASELENHRGWGEFFAQLLLGIISLGIIPFALSVTNKIQHGSWRYSLYATQSEKKMKAIVEAVDEFNFVPTSV